MKKIILYLLLCVVIPISGQDQLTYQKPPAEILQLAEAPLAPRVLMTDTGDYMLLMYRSPYKSIAELSEKELRLAGLRINPVTNIGSRTTYYYDLHIQIPGELQSRPVAGLPDAPRMTMNSPAKKSMRPSSQQ